MIDLLRRDQIARLALALWSLPAVAAAGGLSTSGHGTGGSDTGSGTTDASTTDGGSSTTDGSTTGGSSTGGGSSSTGGGSSSGGAETSGSGSTSGELGSASSADDGCGACPTEDESISFATPPDEAGVDAPFEVVVEAVPRCPCDDCGCAAEDVMYVQLFLDTVAWGEVCTEPLCTWMVTANEGDHRLRALATYASGTAARNLDVVVTSVAPSTTDDGGTPSTTAPHGDDSGTTAAAVPSGEAGCGCTTGPAGAAPWWLALLLWLPAARRRLR